MKKTLIGTVMALMFILGIVISEKTLATINTLFGTQVFKTRNQVEAQLDTCRNRIQNLEIRSKRRKSQLEQFTRSLSERVDEAFVKQMILSASAEPDVTAGRIFLNPAYSEGLVKPTNLDDPNLNELIGVLNQKAEAIIGVSKDILTDKISQLNRDLLAMNSELNDKNLMLIDKLKEVELYKGELETQQGYIRELEGIKTDLEQVVGDLEAKIENGRLRVNFQGDILFNSGSHKLKADGRKLLDSILPILKKGTEMSDIFIAGHTDNVPIKKEFQNKYESNWDLSTYRAIEVVKYLTDKGIGQRNLTAAGYGKFKPVSDNQTADGRNKNRRVELFLIPRFIKRVDEKG